MKFIFFTTLLLFSVNGFAFYWKKVIERKGKSFYQFDDDNLKNKIDPIKYQNLNTVGCTKMKVKYQCKVEDLKAIIKIFKLPLSIKLT